jgi:hypothetical protein
LKHDDVEQEAQVEEDAIIYSSAGTFVELYREDKLIITNHEANIGDKFKNGDEDQTKTKKSMARPVYRNC